MGNNSSNQGIWRDKSILIMHKNATLPYRCIKTNKAASKKVKLKLFWDNPLLLFWLLVNILVYAIVALCLRRKAIVYVPVSEEAISKRKKKIFSIWGFVIAGVALIIIGVNLLNVTLIVVGSSLLIITIILPYLILPLVVVHKIEDDYVWLKGFCEEYLKEFPDWNDNLFIAKVYDNSKAFQYGIKSRDIIKSICNKDVKTAVELRDILKNRDKTRPVKIDLLRGVNTITVEIELQENEKLGVDFK